MKVKLTYFKGNGKYYAEGEYETLQTDLSSIWNEVVLLTINKTLPGLVRGHSNLIISIDVPEHQHNHPHLINIREALEHWSMP